MSTWDLTLTFTSRYLNIHVTNKVINRDYNRPNVNLHKCVMWQNHNSDSGFKLVVDELRSDPIKRLTPSFNVPVAIEAIEKNKKAVFLAVITIISD